MTSNNYGWVTNNNTVQIENYLFSVYIVTDIEPKR